MRRRDFVKTVAGGLAVSNLATFSSAGEPAEEKPAPQHKDPQMYTLTKLPYAFDALEPYIDARTVEIHHTKHQQTYVNNLNAALKEYPQLQGLPVTELIADLSRVPEAIRTAVRNNGGGVANHELYFAMMRPGKPDNPPVGKLAAAIDAAFGGFAAVPAEVRRRRRRPVRQRLGLAEPRRQDGKLDDREHPRPRHARDVRPEAGPGPRRLGARLLLEAPMAPRRFRGRLVAPGGLGPRRAELRRLGRHRVVTTNASH